MRLGSPSRKWRKAFTLIELMLVCLLVAILTALIIPEMKGSYQDALLRATSRKLMDAFDLAYSRAVSRNQVDRVRLEPDTGRYVIEKQVNDGGQESYVPLKDVSDGEGELDRRISIQIRNLAGDVSGESHGAASTQAPVNRLAHPQSDAQSDDAIAFYPDGTADGREVVLRDQAGYGLGLRINPITARVSVVELDRQ